MTHKLEVRVESGTLSFYCPGCKKPHSINYSHGRTPLWNWNGSDDKPTFHPSVKVSWSEPSDDPEKFDDVNSDIHHVCHTFVRDGQIEFLTDCTHPLAGKTVPVPDWPADPYQFI